MQFKKETKQKLMKLKILLLAGVIILTSACQNQKKEAVKEDKIEMSAPQFELPDSLSTRRVSFVLDMKKVVAENAWADFGTKNNEGTLIYFNEDDVEVFFPNSRITNSFAENQKHSDDYFLTKRRDSFPYHMEVMVSFYEGDSTEYFYDNPVEQYSSVEEVGKTISSVESTEMWATMVIHEMFHHYQYNNKNYQEYAKSEIGILPFSIRDIITLCYEDDDFIKMIQKENEHLMKAIAEKDKQARDSIVSTYVNARKNRIQKYSSDYPNLEQVENYYVIQEGSARYIEYKSMFVLSEYAKRAEMPVVANDPMFKSYQEFQEIDLNNDAFSYLTYAARSDFHYTIGFNTMRLLDELNVEYKSSLLNNPEKGLHQYLEDYIENKK